MMDAQRFEAILTAHGADPSRWPPAERADALAFERAEPDTAKAIREAAAGLDTLLAGARAPEPSDVLAARILEAGLAETRFAPRWMQLAAVLALSAGLGLGWGGASLEGGNLDSAAYAAAYSGFADDGYDDIADWVQEEAR
ncbi:hypothetical protein [Glycocaulis sp.]